MRIGRVVIVAVAVLAVAAAGCTSAARHHAARNADPAFTATQATTPAGSSVVARPPSSTPRATTPPAATTAPMSAAATARERYLSIARTVYPAASPAALASRGRRICRTLAAGSSAHDVVGSLSGEVSDAALADRLVVLAREAYCP